MKERRIVHLFVINPSLWKYSKNFLKQKEQDLRMVAVSISWTAILVLLPSAKWAKCWINCWILLGSGFSTGAIYWLKLYKGNKKPKEFPNQSYTRYFRKKNASRSKDAAITITIPWIWYHSWSPKKYTWFDISFDYMKWIFNVLFYIDYVNNELIPLRVYPE